MEIPGSALIIPVVERFGRRRCNVVFYFLTGAALLGLTVTPISELLKAGEESWCLLCAVVPLCVPWCPSLLSHLTLSQLFPFLPHFTPHYQASGG